MGRCSRPDIATRSWASRDRPEICGWPPKLGVEAHELTATPSSQHERTNRWAQAAHAVGFDGLAWMARKCNDAEAYVLFGDRVVDGDLRADPGFARVFLGGDGFDWLVDFCTPLHIEVLTEI